ncbi:MAG: hypothetical protein ACRDFB_03935 [Rhabdochlamydiaceae bacterium]
MSHSVKIECPSCKRQTTLSALKYFNDGESKEDLKKFSSNTDDMITPKFTKVLYHALLKDQIKDSSTTIIISKIGTHKIGLFKENCINSNKMFKVAFYTFMDHEKKVAGFTFRIGEEIYDY